MKNTVIAQMDKPRPVMIAKGHRFPGGRHIMVWNFAAQRAVQEQAKKQDRVEK